MSRIQRLFKHIVGERKIRFQGPLELEIASEAASSLGLSGQRLRKALDALHDYDADVAAGKRFQDPERRLGLVEEAGELYWGYVVQREILGMHDPEYIAECYAIPREVQAKMGPRLPR